MQKDEHIEFTGTVLKEMGGGFYNIELDNGQSIKARLAGKMRKNKIIVMQGDFVKIVVSKYDTTHGMIIRRGK